MWRAQPVLMPGQVAGKKPPQPEREAEEPKEREPEWTSEHAARAADALEGAYSPDFDAEALPPEVTSMRLCSRPSGMVVVLPSDDHVVWKTKNARCPLPNGTLWTG